MVANAPVHTDAVGALVARLVDLERKVDNIGRRISSGSVGAPDYGVDTTGRTTGEANATGFDLVAGYTTLCTLTFPIPDWAQSAQIFAVGQGAAFNHSASTSAYCIGRVRVQVPTQSDGYSTGPASYAPAPVGGAALPGGLFAAYIFHRSVVPGSTLTCLFQAGTSGTDWTADTNNYADFFVVVDFYREAVS